MSALITVTLTCDGKGCHKRPGPPVHSDQSLTRQRRLSKDMGWEYVRYSQMDFCPECWRIRQMDKRKIK